MGQLCGFFKIFWALSAEQRSFMTSKEQFLEGEGVKDVKWMQKIGSSFYTEIKTGSSSGTVIEIPLKHSNNPGETQNMVRVKKNFKHSYFS